MTKHTNKAQPRQAEVQELPMPFVCPKCGAENRPEAKFCDECGSNIERINSVIEIPAISAETLEPNRIWESPSESNPFFSGLGFQPCFRQYQVKALAAFDELRKTQSKFHLVAPPGAGKTIIGIEIIRRLGTPSVIFSPTTTIQAQWRDKFKLFSHSENQQNTLSQISLEGNEIKLINAFTYQLLSTQTDEKEFLNGAALKKWKDDLFTRQKLDDISADARIKSIQDNNAEAFNKEMAHYRDQARKELLTDPNFDIQSLLHPNAKALINELAAKGVRVIVLDECHHLLDYWAIIIRELQKRIGNCFVIGLTATPPYSSDEDELENYFQLVGKVDFEVPTPALVKNGDLAPYQDLVHFVSCTEKEMDFLQNQQAIFLNLARKLANQANFRNHFTQLITKHGSQDGDKVTWDEFLGDNLEVAVSSIRYLRSINVELPREIHILKEMREVIDFNDWLILVECYCLDCLKMSKNADDQQQLTDIKAALHSLGITLSESGLRKYTSPQQRVISLSESKNIAVVEILQHEYRSLGEQLRAVVITDFVKSSPTAISSLKGVLDPESGGASRALRYIISDPETDKIDAVMVTGESVLLDADIADEFRNAAQLWFQQNGLKATFTIKATEYPKISEVIGEGPDWKPRNYVRFITTLFEKGITKCIVGTRGILGEGWDSLSLNTLIDLTSATTYAMVNQVRGRSIRLDPAHPRKVANNWDVVCIVPEIIDGNCDYLRLIRKHDRYYGITESGEIVKGISHLDAELDTINIEKGLNPLVLASEKINARAFTRAANRDAAYDLWRVGQSFDSNEVSVVSVDPRKIKFRSGFTLKNSLRALLASILGVVGGFTLLFMPRSQQDWNYIIENPHTGLVVLAILLGIGLTLGILFSGRLIYKYFKQAFIDLPVDSTLKDIGIAIFEAMRGQGLVSANITTSNIKVSDEKKTGYYRVFLSGTSQQEADLFSQCYAEAMGPIKNQRYLVSRDASSLRGDFFSPLWRTLRAVTRFLRREEIAYHPVPEIFGKTKETAAAFGRAWSRHVGGGKLLYTRTPAGRAVMLKYGLDRRLDLNVKMIRGWH